MSTVPVKCTKCETVATVAIPDDHDGTWVWWECANCGARDVIDGDDPAERALKAPSPVAEGVVLVTESDAGMGRQNGNG